MVKSQTLLKTVSVFLVYFLYSYLLSYFNLGETPWIRLLADGIFLFFIIGMYYKNLKKDAETIKKDYSFGKIVKVVVIGFLLTIVMNVLLSFIMGIFFPNAIADQNTVSIQNMATVSIVYTIFKTMIFGCVAEEILFRESLSDCIPNDWLFVLISSVICTAMNFVFTSTEFSIMQLLVYFLPAILYSLIYIKNKRNIFLVMLIKFVYNIIPLTILLVGLFTGKA